MKDKKPDDWKSHVWWSATVEASLKMSAIVVSRREKAFTACLTLRIVSNLACFTVESATKVADHFEQLAAF